METDRKLFIISGPSGVGKSTLVSSAMKRVGGVELSISATTRKPRIGETPGVEYHFISNEEFDEKVKKNEFLEWAKVHSNKYGTLRSLVRDHLQKEKDVILELDVQGALNVKEKVPNVILIFIKPPSQEKLKERLVKRRTESKKDVEHRLKTAEVEMKFANKYDYIIENKDLKQAIEELVKIIENERAKKTTATL